MTINRRDILKGAMVAHVATLPVVRVQFAPSEKGGDAITVGLIVHHLGSQASYDPMSAFHIPDGDELILRCVNGELQIDMRKRK